ncbi:MAG: leucine-rich repeat domain-containing protein [Bacteroidales bacterium]|nr:leucine-rich repeat domain-containing protein [Bacteroidales bacterium]
MKQFILKLTLMMAVLLSLATPEAYAYDFEYGGIGYTVISTGDLTCRATELVQDVEDLVIPGVVPFQGKELRVISIEKQICKSNTVIKSVSIADEIEEIGESAFERCSNLVSVKLPLNLKEIPPSLFSSCGKLQEIEIPNQVEIIGGFAFSYCDLTSVVIPASTTSIGSLAFYHNYNLKEVKLGTSVKEIGFKAFVGCPLEDFVIPSNVERIYSDSFHDYDFSNEDMFHDLKITIEKSDANLEVKYDYVENPFASWDYVCLNRRIEAVYDKDSHYYGFRIGCKFLEIGEGVSTSAFRYLPYDDSAISVKCMVLCKDARLFGEKPGGEDLDTIVIKSQEPPYCPEFSNTSYMRVKVLVPPGTLEIYQNADGWRNFWNIEESDIASGISDVMTDSAIQPREEYGRYDLSGRKVTGDYRGVVVVKYTDGSTAKVLQQ